MTSSIDAPWDPGQALPANAPEIVISSNSGGKSRNLPNSANTAGPPQSSGATAMVPDATSTKNTSLLDITIPTEDLDRLADSKSPSPAPVSPYSSESEDRVSSPDSIDSEELRKVFDAVDEERTGRVKVSRLLELAGAFLGGSHQVRMLTIS